MEGSPRSYQLSISHWKLLDPWPHWKLWTWSTQKGFSEQEGALYLAYLSYSTFLKSDLPKAKNLKNRISVAEKNWIALGRVNPNSVDAWREKAKKWESDNS